MVGAGHRLSPICCCARKHDAVFFVCFFSLYNTEARQAVLGCMGFTVLYVSFLYFGCM